MFEEGRTSNDLANQYAIDEDNFKGKFGETYLLQTYGKEPYRKFLILGLGKKEEFCPNKFREAVVKYVVPVADKIRFIIGDAITEAPKLGIQFDMAFIDGDKRTYLETYEMALRVVRPGGFILADNTLWDGHVLEQPKAADRQTQGIESFNDYLVKDNRVEQVVLPLRDGLTLIRIK